MESKYCYPNSDVLMNKFGIKDAAKLKTVETYYSGLRLFELTQQPLFGKFNLKHLQAIHEHIFQDVYEFAGHIREENISKGFTFALYPYIKDAASELFIGLKEENYLRNTDINTFSERCAYYMAEINVLHPFREGNGRSTREFIRTLSYAAGYELDWSKIDKESLFNASVRSKSDPRELSQLIKEAIINQEPNRDFTKLFKTLGRELERG